MLAARQRLPSTPQPPASPSTTLDEWNERQLTQMANFGEAYRTSIVRTYQEYMFERTAHQQKTVIEAANLANLPPKIVERLEHCNDQVFVYRNDKTGDHRYNTNACHCRWCPRCGSSQGMSLTRDILSNLPEPQGRLYFLTLTQKKDPSESITAAIHRIRATFAKLRRHRIWSPVLAAAYVLEISCSEQFTFHAHIHAIIDSQFIDYVDLAAAWTAVSGSYAILHIDPVHDTEGAFRYLAKYLTKPVDPNFYTDPKLLAPVMRELHGTQMFCLVGAWRHTAIRKLALEARSENATIVTDQSWTFVGTLDVIMGRASAGDWRAARILSSLGFGSPFRVVRALFDPPASVRAQVPAQPLLPFRKAS